MSDPKMLRAVTLAEIALTEAHKNVAGSDIPDDQSTYWEALKACREALGKPITPPTIKSLTFEQFQATRKWCDDLAKSTEQYIADESETRPAPGYLYLDSLYIDEVQDWWPNNARSEGRWHLLTERSEFITDDLAALERMLYDFAMTAGWGD